MGQVIKIKFSTTDQQHADLILAFLSDSDIYAFEEEKDYLIGYIKAELLNEKFLKAASNHLHTDYTLESIEEENWNHIWEQEFEPVKIQNFAIIRASFHKSDPAFKYDLIITPKMSFGTGHHATTFLMVQAMQSINFSNKSVFDFGTGTGVLAILAEKMGGSVIATDIDEWSIKNAEENIFANNCTNIKIQKTDLPFQSPPFDIILANINKNVILNFKNDLIKMVKPDGYFLLSGFLTKDVIDIKADFIQMGCTLVSAQQKDDWNCLLMKY